MKKIVSISSYGANPRYIVGMHRQYELAKKLYPDWEFRAYVDDASKYHMPDANIIEVTDGSHGVFWRFEPLFESENNIIIVRDADDRITFRECALVNEWLTDSKRFVVYKDHEAHFQFPIMAGTFGCKGRLPTYLHDIMLQFSHDTNYYTNDQVYLRDHIWPLVESDTKLYTLNDGWFGRTRKLLKNPYSFCGNGYDEFDMPLYPNTLAMCAGFDPKKVDLSFKFDGGCLSE